MASGWRCTSRVWPDGGALLLEPLFTHTDGAITERGHLEETKKEGCLGELS